MFAAVPLAHITMDEGRAEMVPSFHLDHGFRDIDASDLEFECLSSQHSTPASHSIFTNAFAASRIRCCEEPADPDAAIR